MIEESVGLEADADPHSVDEFKLVIAVPLFKAPELVPDLFAALIAVEDELAELGAHLILINDSPDHAPLSEMLANAMPALQRRLRVTLWTNSENLGFVRSANRALAYARDASIDIILLNSDARPTVGAFRELAAAVRLDPMTGFASPRSNNATICNSPYPDEFRTGDDSVVLTNHKAIEGLLPRTSYVPTAVGFCLYIRWQMLQEFGLFDEIYGGGYNEENDLIRRCNRRGYRAILANRAYVFHIGSVSFAASERSRDGRDAENHKILVSRYPEYDRAVGRFFRSAEYEAQRLISGLIPTQDGRLRLLFDGRVLKCHYNGTQEHARKLLTAFAAKHANAFEIHVLCSADAFAFHGLDGVPSLIHCTEDAMRGRVFAIAFRLDQPFNLDDMIFLAGFAPLHGFMMLDPIAMDCQQLDDTDLATVWQHMYDTSSLVGYNSETTAAGFRHRFSITDDVVTFVSLCSTDLAEYRHSDAGETPHSSGGMLVVGNHYPHKHIRDAVTALREKTDETITVLGVHVEGEGIVSVHAGTIPQPQVDALYETADLLIFPSHYEGFGLPVLHALAHAKPVVARDIPALREIQQRTTAAANIHLAPTTATMAELAASHPRWQAAAPIPDKGVQTWEMAGDALADAFAHAVRRFDFSVCQRQQLRIAAVRERIAADREAREERERGEHAENRAAHEQRLRRDLIHTLRPASGMPADLQALVEAATALRSAAAPPARQPRWRALFGGAKLHDPSGPSVMAMGDLPPGRLTSLHIDARGCQPHDSHFAAWLLDVAGSLEVGARVTFAFGIPLDPIAEEALAVSLLAAGFIPLPLETGRSTPQICGIKLLEGSDPADGLADDELFIEVAHRRLLGRAASGEELDRARAELASGAPRELLLRALRLGAERRALIHSQLHLLLPKRS